MAKDLMGYERLAQDALRTVVRQSIDRAAGENGLPGAHHFYITFRTTDPGCDIDESLMQAYPDEMTIVLEHQFWDLSSSDDGFEVTLKFSGVPKYLSIPWRAVTRFHDPSVNFRLHFDYQEPDPEDLATSKDTKNDSDGEATVVSLAEFRKKD